MDVKLSFEQVMIDRSLLQQANRLLVITAERATTKEVQSFGLLVGVALELSVRCGIDRKVVVVGTCHLPRSLHLIYESPLAVSIVFNIR